MSKEQPKINDGGPVFPLTHDRYYHEGMTLRQWYAGMAMMGYRASGKIGNSMHEFAFEDADLMLKHEQEGK